jgi:hypothetical protein
MARNDTFNIVVSIMIMARARARKANGAHFVQPVTSGVVEGDGAAIVSI